ncbi:all-trans retinoic acid-induced differentiation factor [Bufo bufo]|uniref:all-trans retinoic acid-induced differentiation factor n=1 Tax=Bufo bufo TaxID=8384 RepID=UPI001ABE22F5|nr:all-trans retinoic acid-induced differentiation factor [Bufo bufo]
MAAGRLVCLLFLMSGALAEEQLVCTSCPGEMTNVTELGRRCAATPGARIVSRCCVTGADTITGLDLHNCSLSHLDPTINLTAALAAIDLSQNPLQDLCNKTFQGLTGLEYIALPPNISCPGGDGAWTRVNISADVRICQDQRDGCNTTDVAPLCPENSLCAPAGPGYTQCLCVPGFSGYKCLREGSFPTLLFFGILASVTLTLSILLWCTQRKKVKSL